MYMHNVTVLYKWCLFIQYIITCYNWILFCLRNRHLCLFYSFFSDRIIIKEIPYDIWRTLKQSSVWAFNSQLVLLHRAGFRKTFFFFFFFIFLKDDPSFFFFFFPVKCFCNLINISCYHASLSYKGSWWIELGG